MTNFALLIWQFLVEDDGPTGTEYAIMLALIVLLAFAAIAGLGTSMDATFTSLDGKVPTGAAP